MSATRTAGIRAALLTLPLAIASVGAAVVIASVGAAVVPAGAASAPPVEPLTCDGTGVDPDAQVRYRTETLVHAPLRTVWKLDRRGAPAVVAGLRHDRGTPRPRPPPARIGVPVDDPGTPQPHARHRAGHHPSSYGPRRRTPAPRSTRTFPSRPGSFGRASKHGCST